MRIKRTIIYLALVVSALLAACSCSQKTGMETGAIASYEEINRMANTWNHHNATGHQDSIIIDTRPFLAKVMEKRDTVSAQYSLAFMAQAWLLLENRDSLDRYLSLFEQWKTPELLPHIGIIYSNVLGHYALKFRLDYAQALSHYLDVYEYAKDVNDVQNEITTLYNIVSIYNIRADAKGGLPYAREALVLAMDKDAKPFHKTAAYMAMSYSFLSPETLDSAQYYLTQANMTVFQNRLDYWLAILNLQQADILTLSGNYQDAAGHYESALAYSHNAEPSTITEIYLKYGRLNEYTGDYRKAAELYFQGIRVSNEMENMEFRLPLYKDLAEVLYKTHNNDLAAQFLREYTILLDSFSVEQNGHEFYNSISAYNRLKNEYEITVRDFELKEARSSMMIILLTAGLIIIVMGVVIYLHHIQNKKNQESIRLYQSYLQQLELNTQARKASSEDPHIRLFNTIEEKMQAGLFRQKNLTLDKLAETVGSNRTYVSNTINSIAGVSFNSYVDTYRIKEATRVLSDPTMTDVSLKQLADDVGYSSIQTFFAAFKRETGTTPGMYRKERLKNRTFTDS